MLHVSSFHIGLARAERPPHWTMLPPPLEPPHLVIAATSHGNLARSRCEMRVLVFDPNGAAFSPSSLPPTKLPNRKLCVVVKNKAWGRTDQHSQVYWVFKLYCGSSTIIRVVALFLIGLYLCLLYGLYVPDWEYQIPIEPSSAPKIYSVKCGVRADTGPACNAVGMIDREILGIQHLYRRPIYARTHECSINSPDYGSLPPDAPAWCQAPFDPEGLLSSTMAIVTCFIGLHYGHIIVHFKDHRVRILHWMIPTFCLVVFGRALDTFGMHINKVLYTFSYMCVTAGAAGILLAGIYLMVDVCGYSCMTIVMEWMGMHALMIYILAACNILPIILQGFYLGKSQNNIVISTSLPNLFVIFYIKRTFNSNSESGDHNFLLWHLKFRKLRASLHCSHTDNVI